MAKKTTRKTTPKAVKTAVKASAKSADAVQQLFQPVGVDELKSHFEKFAPAHLVKGFEDASQSGKDNIEAVVKSGQIFAKAAEELNKAISSFAQSSLELNMQASQALLGARSLQDLVEVQSELARNSFDHFIAGSSKISDMAMKVTNEALEPIQSRVSYTIEKISKAA